ncbi:hypothetical protein FE257_008553 [Aspergillus nanangensis]|uniref:Rhodopsin domain-containing protein n=1 Tax=Aspergillus nanangensis TaxID=2582783 RepID=A0AAD4CLD9_ASPNN|nr:hypothetical protein FE257_008553 [Aspergillus nanangensis]
MAEPDQWKRTLIAVPIVGATLATVSFLLRLWSVHRIGRRWDIGDLFLGLGLLFSYGLTICAIIVAFNGIGRDIWSLPRETRARVTLLLWITQKFWPLTQLCVKISIILLLRRLLGSFSGVILTTTWLIVFTVAWAITAVVANTLQCLPPQYFWIKSIEGRCMPGQTTLFITMGVTSLAEDIVLLLVPVIVVWRLKMPRQQKRQLILLFSIGGVVCIFSLLRLVEFPNYRTGNLTESGGLETIWSLLELDLAIVCSSFVLMRPIFQRCFGKIKTFSKSLSLSRSQKRQSAQFSVGQYFVPHLEVAPNFSNLDQDAYSEVRSKVTRVPTLEMRQQQTGLAMGDIMVETSIDRDVQAREAILATMGDGSSLRNSTLNGSTLNGSILNEPLRAGSVGSARWPSHI